MNRLVLIGNGFDLAHGLKTSYADFFYWYWKNRISKFYDEYSNVSKDVLCSLIDLHKQAWNITFFYDSNLKYGNGKEIYHYLTSHPDMFEIKSSEFFANICKSIETKNWVDIENEYYSLLALLHGFVENNYLNLNKQLEFLRDKLIDYLRLESNNIVEVKDCIIEKLNYPILKQEIAVSSNVYQDIRCNDTINPESTMLLSFNYTNIIKRYERNVPRIEVNYIHGQINEPQSVIFGYGDELDKDYQKLREQKDNECLRHIKSIRYLESDNYRKILEFIESAPFQICIMGHSCGNSDRTLLNTLFEHMNCISIKPYYYKKEDGTDNYLELVQNISRNFTDMKLMRDRVVNKTYCEPLTNKK